MTERERAERNHRAAVAAFEDANADAEASDRDVAEAAEAVRATFRAVAAFDADRRGTVETETETVSRRDARRGTVETAHGSVGFRRIGC